MATALEERAVTGLARRYQTQQMRLAKRTNRAVASAWNSLVVDVSDQAQARFAATAARLVGSAQLQSIELAGAYIAGAVELLGLSAGKPLSAASLVLDLRDGTPLADVYSRPLVTARRLLSEGQPLAVALRSARHRALLNVDTDAQLAARAGTSAALERSEARWWQRVPNAGACPFCVLVSDRPYSTRDLMPIHPRCFCTVKPLDRAVRPRGLTQTVKVTKTLADGTRKTYTYGPKDVAVQQHGELGPVLGQKGQDFTGLEDV